MRRLSNYLNTPDSNNKKVCEVNDQYDILEAGIDLSKHMSMHRKNNTTTTVVKNIYDTISPDEVLGLEECDVGKTLSILNTNLKILGESDYIPVDSNLIGYEGILDSTISGIKKFFKIIGKAIKAIIEYIINLIKKFLNYIKNIFTKNTKTPDEKIKESLDKAEKKAKSNQQDLETELNNIVENPTKEMLTTKEKILWEIPMLVYMVKGINDHNLDDITDAITEVSRKFSSKFNISLISSLIPTNTIEYFNKEKAIDKIIMSAKSDDTDIFGLAYRYGENMLKDINSFSNFPYVINTSYISPLLNNVIKDIIRTIKGYRPTDRIILTTINGTYISYMHVRIDLEDYKDSIEQFKEKIKNTNLETIEDAIKFIVDTAIEAKNIIKKVIISINKFTVNDLESLNIPIKRYIEDTDIPVVSVINEAEIKLRVFKELMDENKTGLKDMDKFQTELKILKTKYNLVDDVIKNNIDTSSINAKKIVSGWHSYSELVLHVLDMLEKTTITYVDFYKANVEVGNKLTKYVTILSNYYIKLI